jgi:uncharacterized protein YecE (DUF72 family)
MRIVDAAMPKTEKALGLWRPSVGFSPQAGCDAVIVARIGTSGWSYDHWDGELYPAGTPPAKRLDLYMREFDTVELNASHYRWPRNAAFAGWRNRLPAQFSMSVKAPRGLTHAKKLYSPEVWVDRIAASWHELYDRRGALLVQLPPTLERDDERLGWFLDRLPWWVQVAVEMRHPSWHQEEVFDLLARHGASYCVMSGAGLPCVLRSTAPLVYVRLHGPSNDWLYAGSYSDDELSWWADRIGEWERAGQEVYAYFNNDGGGNAVRNARRIREVLNS